MGKKIIHIYSGSQASGGLYLKKITDTLDKIGGFQQRTIVSYYYPFNSNSKVFFRFTDLASKVEKTKIRLILRYIELIFGLVYSIFYITYFKPDIVNYSLNSSFKVEYWFLLIINRINRHRLFITCHDVIPFKSSIISEEKDIKRRKKIFAASDKLIVHNEQSIFDLIKYFQQKENKILFHPFPIMDMQNLNISESEFELQASFDFCFLGHLREEKGLNLLLDTWKEFIKEKPDAKLIIAGNKASDSFDLDQTKLKKINITLIEKYLPDSLYYNIIKNSKCIILPYLKGTNSGILSTIISADINIIASDIELFNNHTLIDKTFIFKNGDSFDLLKKLKLVYGTYVDNSVRLTKIENYNKEFREKIKIVYS